MGKVPLPVLKELEHQARQNFSTINFTAAFAKTSSSSRGTLLNSSFFSRWSHDLEVFDFLLHLSYISQ